MKHNYNSENRCVNCGAYRDAVNGGDLICLGTPDVTVNLSTRPPMTEYVLGTEPPGKTYPELYPPLDSSTYRRKAQQISAYVDVSLGERIAYLRRAAGLTETGIAAVMNCTPAEYEAMTAGVINPTSDQLMALAIEVVRQVYKAHQGA